MTVTGKEIFRPIPVLTLLYRPDQTWFTMKTVNIQAAKTHLSRLVEEAAAGEEIILAKAGRPLIRLVPFSARNQPRKLGLLKGRVRESKACWDRDPALESQFSDEPVVPRPNVRPNSTKKIR